MVLCGRWTTARYLHGLILSSRIKIILDIPALLCLKRGHIEKRLHLWLHYCKLSQFYKEWELGCRMDIEIPWGAYAPAVKTALSLQERW